MIQPPEPSLPALEKTEKPKTSNKGFTITFSVDNGKEQQPVKLDIINNYLATNE